MSIANIQDARFIDASELGAVEGMSALAIAKKMLEDDPESEVLRKAVEILSQDPAEGGILRDAAALAGAEQALMAHPGDPILREAVVIAQESLK